MKMKLLIGLDGHGSGDRALAHGMELAKMAGGCELCIAYVIEWSPFSFQTSEENAERHKRREEEISLAKSRIIEPALKQVKDAGLTSVGVVRHGDVAETLKALAKENGADQIVVGRASEGGFAQRIFGSAASNLVMSAKVPVTVVN